MTSQPVLAVDLADLDDRMGIAGRVRFETSPLGGPVAILENPTGRVVVSLFGGQVLDWVPAGQSPVLWCSPLARLDAWKPVRGGIPICWPWFGPAGDSLVTATGKAWPQHGFARTAMWRVVKTGDGPEGCWVTLGIAAPADVGKGWPHKAEAQLTIVLAQQLEMRLVTRNQGSSTIDLTQALHAYFRVGDISEVIIEGLAGHVFHDAVAIGPALTMSTVLRSQTGPVSFDGEVDRVYLEQRGPVSILDRRLGRRITITKTGSRSTVVWNPWQNKSDGLGDMGDDGFKQMVCVEAANTIYDAIVLPPQQSAEITVTYESAPL